MRPANRAADGRIRHQISSERGLGPMVREVALGAPLNTTRWGRRRPQHPTHDPVRRLTTVRASRRAASHPHIIHAPTHRQGPTASHDIAYASDSVPASSLCPALRLGLVNAPLRAPIQRPPHAPCKDLSRLDNHQRGRGGKLCGHDGHWSEPSAHGPRSLSPLHRREALAAEILDDAEDDSPKTKLEVTRSVDLRGQRGRSARWNFDARARTSEGPGTCVV